MPAPYYSIKILFKTPQISRIIAGMESIIREISGIRGVFSSGFLMMTNVYVLVIFLSKLKFQYTRDSCRVH
jgi:hypothetical protein